MLIPLVRCVIDAVEWFGTLVLEGIRLHPGSESPATQLHEALTAADTGPFQFEIPSIDPNGIRVMVRLREWSPESLTTAAGFVLAVCEGPVSMVDVRSA